MKNIKKFLIPLLLLLLAFTLVMAFLMKENEDVLQEKKTGEKSINLIFIEVPRIPLKEAGPEEGWVKAKSIYFKNLENQVESTVHLYLDKEGNTDMSPDEGAVYGFIDHDNRLFEIGLVGSYGIDKVTINTVDRNYDGVKEIEIIGDMGAAYREMIIIAYNENSRQWENLLTMGSPKIVDLDDDGKEELIAASAGSLPPFVEIYRWNINSFEKADITESTSSSFSLIYMEKDQWIIETGIIEDNKALESVLYKYYDGSLIPIGK